MEQTQIEAELEALVPGLEPGMLFIEALQLILDELKRLKTKSGEAL